MISGALENFTKKLSSAKKNSAPGKIRSSVLVCVMLLALSPPGVPEVCRLRPRQVPEETREDGVRMPVTGSPLSLPSSFR